MVNALTDKDGKTVVARAMVTTVVTVVVAAM